MPKILVVDDEEDYRHIVKLILEPEGYDIVEAKDGKDGLSVLQSEKPDLVILDVNMPKMDGFTVCKKIRKDEMFKYIPVIMLTVRNLTQEQVKGFDNGADEYLTKPFESAELVSRVKSLFKRCACAGRGSLNGCTG